LTTTPPLLGRTTSSRYIQGRFDWGGVNFSESAEEIRFELEGGGEPILRAVLKNREGESVGADINLAERIDNQDGNFVFGK
jgi:hypothetical protein